jgi:GAF domain-containing protein
VRDEKKKSGLDEQAFGKLLEAAYVLQEHNRQAGRKATSIAAEPGGIAQSREEASRALFPGAPAGEGNASLIPDYALTLAEIVDTQHQIQTRDFDGAMALVCESASRITKAKGAAIGILDGKGIRYCGRVGSPAPPLGTEVPLETALSASCVRSGQVLRLPDVSGATQAVDFELIDLEQFRTREIQSLTAVPIYHEGKVSGALEVYYDRANGFAEQDILTCQLLAGLVTEAINRDAGLALRKSMAAERSSMLAAIEKIKPNLAALAGGHSPASDADKNTGTQASGKKPDTALARARESVECWKCGNALLEQEQFCGKCGAPRIGESDPSSIQSKLASALHMHQASQELPYPTLPEGFPELVVSDESGDANADLIKAEIANVDLSNADQTRESEELPEPFSFPLLKGNGRNGEDTPPAEEPAQGTEERNGDQVASAELPNTENNIEHPSTALVPAQSTDVPWSSAAKARSFLEGLGQNSSRGALSRFWRARRGDFYLVVAVILVLVAIRWGIVSNQSTRASNGAPTAAGSSLRHKSPADDLSLFDKLLINLGLAEAPEAPEYKYLGNPSTQVWVDSHTALYYCPGSELYGKTPKGRYTSQHEAQLDQFEPASRRACD